VAEPVLAKALLLGCRVLQASDFEAGTSTMDRPPINPKPVVEPGADELEHGELTTHALRVRIRQQEILAELGVLALQARPFLELLNETPRLTAEGMEAEFCKVLEFCRLKIGFWFAQASVGTRASSGWQRSGLILSPFWFCLAYREARHQQSP
jgi:hypothetical protein